MATSNTEIVNAALVAIGHDPISSLADDKSAAGILARIKWPEVRDTILRAANWRCLLKRSESLAREATTPPFGYRYAYALPPDCVRVAEFSVNQTLYRYSYYRGTDWAVEGRRLLTDEISAYILYVAYDKAVDPVALFDGHMTAAIAAQLAADLAPGLKSSARYPQLAIIAKDKLAEAKVFSAIEARPQTANPTPLGRSVYSDGDLGTNDPNIVHGGPGFIIR